MAEKKTTRSVEDILTDIHNTLVESGEAVLAKLTEIQEALVMARTAEVAGAPVKVEVTKPEKPTPAAEPEEDDKVPPKFVREYLKEHPKATSADLVRDLKIAENKAQVWAPVGPKAGGQKAKDSEITQEMLRKKIGEFAEAFSMNEALAINEQFGGSRKLSGIPTVKYGFVYAEMDSRLKEDKPIPGQTEPQNEAPTVTKEDIQKVGGAFVKQYGDPAFRELLAKFVEKGKDAKISNVAPAKYAALHEALANA